MRLRAAWLLGVLLAPGPVRAKGPPMGGLRTWIVPWDAAEAEEADCFEEARPFAFALSPAPALLAAYPDLLKASLERRRAGAIVIPVVVNDVISDGKIQSLKSAEALKALLSERKAMLRHVGELSAAAREFDGLEIDYERVPAELWQPFVEFIESLSTELHKEGKKLYVDLEPKLFYDKSWPGKFGKRLARGVDGIDLMAYYERGSESEAPGATNSLPWVIETARRALLSVPREKLVTVLSLAATDWSDPLRGERLNYGQALKLMLESRAEVLWDAASSCPYFRAMHAGRTHEVWFENERSLGEKIAALRKLGAERIGLWYWGRRHPDFDEIGSCSKKGSLSRGTGRERRS